MTTQAFDIVIAGGGIVGLSLANYLAGSDFSIALVERQPAMAVSAHVDSRVSAINPFALRHYAGTGVFDSPLAPRIGWFEHMQVWDAGGAGTIGFHADEMGVPELGAIIENHVLQAMLLARIEDAANIQIYSPASIEHIEYSGHEAEKSRLELAHGDQRISLEASLLVGADGVASRVRQQAGIERHQASYEQQGVVCNVAVSEGHASTAWQSFHTSGPLAFLPLFNGDCSIVWSLDDAEAGQIMALDDDQFCQALAAAADYRLGDVLSATERRAFALGHGHVDQYVSPGLALIGDAAHNIHPLAGQGANLGIADAIALGEVISHARMAGRQWASLNTLGRYQRQRKGTNQLMEASMTGFKRLFGDSNPFVSELRNTGLMLVDTFPAVKNRMVRVALGL